jgi:hypothetical protein
VAPRKELLGDAELVTQFYKQLQKQQLRYDEASFAHQAFWFLPLLFFMF